MFKKNLALTIFVLIIIGSPFCCAKNNNEWDYILKIKKQDEKIRYKKSLLPESGNMTVEEYEKKSKAKDKSVGDGDFVKAPNSSDYKYLPQPKYKVVRYNDPVGTPELNIHRKLKYDREEVLQGITSSDFKIMVVPIVSYYSKTNSTECDLFVVPLNQRLSDIDKVIKANIAAKNPKPILETDRTFIEPSTFKSITPIDFSADNTKLLAKEKVGNIYDGIWQTDIVLYDFNTKKSKKLVEIREAIRYYWLTHKNLDLKEIRWDIYPLGFSAVDSNRIIVTAYAFTGKDPASLGIWSIDCNGEQSRLLSITNVGVPVAQIGYKIAQDGIIDMKSFLADEKRAKKFQKYQKKEEKKELKQKHKLLKKQHKENIKNIKNEQKKLKENSESKFKKGLTTGID